MTQQAEAGKGDAMRKSNDDVAYAKNFETIFGLVGPLERKKREEAMRQLQLPVQEPAA